MVIVRPDTLKSIWSPGRYPALRRMLVGTVISLRGLRVMVIVVIRKLIEPRRESSPLIFRVASRLRGACGSLTLEFSIIRTPL
jgi:multisubunit Na+/H+ antiporter MnhE subunit